MPGLEVKSYNDGSPGIKYMSGTRYTVHFYTQHSRRWNNEIHTLKGPSDQIRFAWNFIHRRASPFSPFSPFANGSLPFVSSSTNGQTTNFRLHKEQRVNGSCLPLDFFRKTSEFPSILNVFIYKYSSFFAAWWERGAVGLAQKWAEECVMMLRGQERLQTENGTNGKRRLPFVYCKRERKRRTSVCLLQNVNGKRKCIQHECREICIIHRFIFTEIKKWSILNIKSYAIHINVI
jgi:hypothetical protein